MTDVRVTTADSDGEREDAFAVRQAVFVDEQDVDEHLEWDDWDDDAATTHVAAYATAVEAVDVEDDVDEGADADAIDRERPVGAARLRPKDRDEAAVGKVERVAVVESVRGTGVGRALMDELEAVGRDRGFDAFLLHSQTQAAGFYERLGYERFGDEFDEAGIPHVKMRKDA
ncbi:GNAT family N-acetyltransferase [Halorubellus sp. JP-L1]|uniref:GNAT family N-acetyltransferase n=1 Tax=Halorubellus sp. JP-L1 TaxID=2715753 RepID=UPI00140C0C63|nr:GNAT family N-acetyltransferase [Halorubellus sp. JP-L1]NHN41339.1 GNAT family N-acetyltransferase [Halorubellus sp. JP-L1]